MKTIIFIIGFFMLSNRGNVVAQDNHSDKQGIHFFNGSWDEALLKAKKENKPIFLDVYATWCRPCKLLKQQTFPDPDAGKYFNENFINVSIDAEKGDGVALARMLKVYAYPALYILNSEGDPVLYNTGFLNPEGLLELGKTGVTNLASKGQLKD